MSTIQMQTSQANETRSDDKFEPAKVSVVMPVYNGLRYVEETLNSVRTQSHPNLEIIVVDDGSTDGTIEYLQEQPDVVAMSQANQGPGAARNAGAARATGEWLAFIDADDLWEPEKLRKQLETAGETGAELIYTNSRPFGQVTDLAPFQHPPGTMPSGDLFEQVLSDNFITLSSVIIRKAVFEELSGFSPDDCVKGTEDWDLWLRYLNTDRSIAAVDEPLVGYRWHSSNLSSNVVKMHKARLAAMNRALQSTRGQALTPEQKRAARRELFSCTAWFATRQGDLKAIPMYREYLRHGGRYLLAMKGIARTFINRLRKR